MHLVITSGVVRVFNTIIGLQNINAMSPLHYPSGSWFNHQWQKFPLVCHHVN